MSGEYFEWTGSLKTMVKYYSLGKARIAMRAGTGTSSGRLSYLFSDHLGSTTMRADGISGMKLTELRYKPWGESRYSSGTTPTKHRYTGQISEESGIGLYYYGARFYDAALSRWAQPDSMVPVDVQGVQAWDRYAYSVNNPLSYTDPSGHFAIPAMLLGAGIGAIVGGAISGATYAITNQGKNFEWGEFAVAAGGGAIAGALVGSGIGMVAGAVSTATAAGASIAATADAVTAVAAASTSLISAGTSAEIAGLSYMAQTPGSFEAFPYVIGSAVSGVVGYSSPGASFGAKVCLNTVGAELTYAVTAKNPTLEGAVASGLGGALMGAVDWGIDAVVSPFLDTFVRMYPGPVARATGAAADGFSSNVGGNYASYYAQKRALEAK